MKRVVLAPAALDRLADILARAIERFGEVRAEAYAAQLAERIGALASGTGAKVRSCGRLMRGVRDAPGLSFCREGSHCLILREKAETLKVVEIFHERMNIEAHLKRLIASDRW